MFAAPEVALFKLMVRPATISVMSFDDRLKLSPLTVREASAAAKPLGVSVAKMLVLSSETVNELAVPVFPAS